MVRDVWEEDGPGASPPGSAEGGGEDGGGCSSSDSPAAESNTWLTVQGASAVQHENENK